MFKLLFEATNVRLGGGFPTGTFIGYIFFSGRSVITSDSTYRKHTWKTERRIVNLFGWCPICLGVRARSIVDELPCTQNRYGKQNGELPLLCHFVGLYVALNLASRHDQTMCQ